MRILSHFSFLAIGAALVAGGCGSSSSSSSGGSPARELVPTNVAIGSLANIGGVAYFLRTEFETGVEPWISDGTLNGTLRIMDIYQGPLNLSVEPPHFTEFAGSVFFFFDDGTHGVELWRTDGTEAGTELAADLVPGPDGLTRTRALSSSDERLYVSDLDSLWGLELSDAQAGNSVPQLLAVVGVFPLVNIDGVAYFTGFDAEFGAEPWISDGTVGGTRVLKDVRVGGGGSNSIFMDPGFVEFGGFVYFFADDGMTGYELWRTDGTEAGTELFADLVPGPEGMRRVTLRASEERLYLLTENINSQTFRDQLWAIELPDGAGMQFVTELTPLNIRIEALENIDGVAYFLLNHPAVGSEMWISDGTPEGTGLLKDIFPGPGSGAAGFGNGVFPIVALDGLVYFFAYDGIAGRELWRTDGTEGRTALFADLVPGADGFTFGFLSVSNERLYLTGFRFETGGQVFVIEASP